MNLGVLFAASIKFRSIPQSEEAVAIFPTLQDGEVPIDVECGVRWAYERRINKVGCYP